MASISNLQESLTINFGIATTGLFPSGAGGSGSDLSIATIRMYGFNFLPGGHADTDGSTLQIASNQALFALMGTAFGGDGRTDFAMPDLQSNLAVGAGAGPGLTNRQLGSEFGNDLIDIQKINLPTSVGGGGQPVNNVETSTAIIYAINTGGSFPSRGGGDTTHGFLGQVQPFAVGTTSDFALPRGWTPADGRVLPINDNDALFSVIGTIYGGDGRTTFALPDLSGRVPIGADSTVRLGQKVGSETLTLQQSNLPSELLGQDVPINNTQPGLGLNFIVALTGVFPSNGSGSASPSDAFVGEISMFAGTFAPNGWALAHGQNIAIQQNPALFSLYGTQFGGDGRTFFTLPDFRGRTAIDEGPVNRVGEVQGETFTTIRENDLADLLEPDSFVVTILDDIVNPFDGETSLREAVTLANATFGEDEITFKPDLASGELLLVQGDINITDDTILRGDVDDDGTPDITVSASSSRIFDAEAGRLTLEEMKLDGGSSVINGGLVNVGRDASLAAYSTEFSNGSASSYGGAIYSASDELVLYNVTVRDNAAFAGGGIAVAATTSASTTVLKGINLTVAGNSADTGGGLVQFRSGLFSLTNSTITSNTATYSTGGIFDNVGGAIILDNTILSGNAAPVFADINETGSDPDFDPVSPTTRNIVAGEAFTGALATASVDMREVFDQTDTLGGGVYGGLLAANGGGLMTVALKADFANPAIDAGSATLFPTDGRLELRPGDIPAIPDLDNGADIGAFEVQTEATPGPDILFGTSGAESLGGGAGNDLLLASTGNDTIEGGEGTDTLSYALFDSPGSLGGRFGATVNLSNDATAQNTRFGIDLITGIENLTGSQFSDLLTGDDNANTIDGGAGRDLIRGGDGSDFLHGGIGFDVVEGGAGADFLFGGTDGPGIEADRLSFSQHQGDLVFNFGATVTEFVAGTSEAILEDTIADDFEGIVGAGQFSNTFNAENLTTFSFLVGGSQADQFLGGARNDAFIGLAGDDVMFGNDGRDGLRGDAGDDELFGGADSDFFFFDGVNDGADVIFDFEIGSPGVGDFISFSGPRINGFDDLIISVADLGGEAASDILITYHPDLELDSSIAVLDVDVDAATFEATAQFLF